MPLRSWSFGGSDRIVGRDDILNRVSSDIEGKRGVIFRGPAGAGKTRLLREVCARAAGLKMLSLQATASTASVPLGVFVSLFGRDSFTATSGRTVDEAGNHMLVTLAARVRSAVLENATDVIAVDDAHLLDSASAGLLLELARTGVLVFATVRDGVPVQDAIVALWRAELAHVIRVPPLGAQHADELIALVLGAPADGGLSRAVQNKCDGNPLFLREVVRTVVETGVAQFRSGLWTLNGPLPVLPDVTDFLSLRFDLLDPGLRHVVEVIALAETLPTGEAVSLVGESNLELAEERALVTVAHLGESTVIRLAHPLYRDAVLNQLPLLRRSRIYRQLGDLLEARTGDRTKTVAERVSLARWRMEQGEPPPVVELLTLAELVHSSDPALCDRFVTAATSASRSVEDTLRLANLLVHRHRPSEAEDVLAGLDAASLSADARTRIILDRSYLLAMVWHDPDAAIALLDSAIAEVGPLPSLRAHRTTALWQQGLFTEATELGSQVFDDSVAPVGARVLAGTVLGLLYISRSDPDAYESLRSRMLPLLAPAASSVPEGDETISLQDVLKALNIEQDMRLAIQLARAGYERALQRGNDGARTEYAHLIAWSLVLSGDVPSALPLFHEVDAGRGMWARTTRPWVRSHYVRALVLAGAADEARETLDRILAEPHSPVHDVSIALAEASVLASQGALHEAGRWCARAGDHAMAMGQTERARAAWYSGLRYGDISSAGHIVREFRQPRTSIDEAKRRQAKAWLDGDAQETEQAATILQRSGLLWYAIDAQAQAVALYRRAGDVVSESAGTAKLARIHGRAPGLRSSTELYLSEPTALTPRELEIAHLAAKGNPDRVIANLLGISVRTVTTHLGHVYAKLGLPGRGELGLLLNPEARAGSDARAHRGRDSR